MDWNKLITPGLLLSFGSLLLIFSSILWAFIFAEAGALWIGVVVLLMWGLDWAIHFDTYR